jgi:hypothetical protein
MPASGLAIPTLLASLETAELTLLELVQAICDETSDDREVVATVRDLLVTGRVRLCGNFRSFPPSHFL